MSRLPKQCPRRCALGRFGSSHVTTAPGINRYHDGYLVVSLCSLLLSMISDQGILHHLNCASLLSTSTIPTIYASSAFPRTRGSTYQWVPAGVGAMLNSTRQEYRSAGNTALHPVELAIGLLLRISKRWLTRMVKVDRLAGLLSIQGLLPSHKVHKLL